MWARFTARFEWRPHPRQVIVYMPGNQCSVTRRCGAAAIKAGKAVEIPAPNRDEAKTWRQDG